MCLVLAWNIRFSAKLIEDWLSLKILNWYLAGWCRSSINCLSQVLSCAAIIAEQYSALVIDNAIVGCLLLHYDIAPDPKLKEVSSGWSSCATIVTSCIFVWNVICKKCGFLKTFCVQVLIARITKGWHIFLSQIPTKLKTKINIRTMLILGSITWNIWICLNLPCLNFFERFLCEIVLISNLIWANQIWNQNLTDL